VGHAGLVESRVGTCTTMVPIFFLCVQVHIECMLCGGPAAPWQRRGTFLPWHAAVQSAPQPAPAPPGLAEKTVSFPPSALMFFWCMLP